MSNLELMKPNEFFRNKITSASTDLSIFLGEDVEFYLVNLLCDFIDPNNFKMGKLDLLDTPLALIYKQAVEASPQMQVTVYKKLGDLSLYVAGYFYSSLQNKTVGPKYYISMGSSAYSKISSIMEIRHQEKHFTEMYSKLSAEFTQLVKVITRVSKELPIESNNLLRIYEKWCTTQSQTLKAFLMNEGVVVDDRDENIQ